MDTFPARVGGGNIMTVQDKIDTKFLKDTVADVVVKACSACAVARPEDAARLRLVELSLLFPFYYVGLSLRIGGLYRRERTGES